MRDPYIFGMVWTMSDVDRSGVLHIDTDIAIEKSKSPDDLYQDLISRVRLYHPSDDISLIEKAYAVAEKAHEGQKRKSGQPYIVHPLQVAIILADLEMDKETIVAGLLHDVVEDTVMTAADIE